MSTTAVFVPVSLGEARRLRDGAELDARTAYAVGPDLLEAHGLQASDDEEAGFVALGYAGLAALLDHTGPRLVVAADVDATQTDGRGDDFGTVQVSAVRWSQVTAVFADEPAAADDLEEIRRLAAGRPLPEVADDEAVVGLVDRWDLLWYAPEELDAATG